MSKTKAKRAVMTAGRLGGFTAGTAAVDAAFTTSAIQGTLAGWGLVSGPSIVVSSAAMTALGVAVPIGCAVGAGAILYKILKKRK